MNERAERARRLGEQLTAAMGTLGLSTHGPDVVVFLDRLARLEAYPAAELAEPPGLLDLIAEAQRVRSARLMELGRAAGLTFDLDQLLHDGRHLPADDAGAARSVWLHDVLTLATVAPWLSPARRRQASWTLEKASARVEADAEAFLEASGLVFDRRAQESPEGLGEEARAFLELLADLPLVVAFDRVQARPSVGRVEAALRKINRAVLDAADDALLDHRDRKEIRLPSPADRHQLAAADDAVAVLVRMERGAWVVTQKRGTLRLSFEGEEADLAVWIEGGAPFGAVLRDEAGEFVLPQSDVGLDIRLCVGADSRRVRLDAAGA
ncbi:MAG: hypothetical protein IPN01_37845 [Deltaproteobacteria bacterium]|nr:hypothetical protein [Deltaproteobacteria bacterium]